MRIASKTDIGRVRRSNQDSYASGELPGGMAFAVVCDGMGGMNGGNIASVTAVKIISEHISSSYREGMGSNSIRSLLQSAIYAANVSVYDMSRSVESLAGMGTTVVAVLMSGGFAYIGHVGDSRAYHYGEGRMEQITRDHSVVQNMLESGKLTPDEAKLHPQKNVITRALGVAETVEMDYNEIPMEEEDVLLICTDGLSSFVGDDKIREILSQSNFYAYPDKLIEKANENGGGDNITVVVLMN